MIASAWFHVALFIERLFATFIDMKARLNGAIGLFLGFGIVVSFKKRLVEDS
jgi:hypothetical protein